MIALLIAVGVLCVINTGLVILLLVAETLIVDTGECRITSVNASGPVSASRIFASENEA